MSKSKELSLKEVIRKSAITWVGETNLENTYMVLVNFNKNTYWVIVEKGLTSLTQEPIIKLNGSKEILSLSTEVNEIIFEVFPDWKGTPVSKSEISMLPKGLTITKDLNLQLLDKEIKPLKEVTVKTFLDNLGVNITTYNYSTIKADNSFSFSVDPIVEGYDNYDPQAIAHMSDVSQYKTGFKIEYPALVDMVLGGCPNNIILYGPAGTGKSTEFRIAAAQREIPIFLMQFSSAQDQEDFLSSFILEAGKAGVVKLKRSPFTYGFEFGGIIQLDELNYLNAGQLSKLNSALDSIQTITLEDGTIIHRNPSCRIVCTMNPNYTGTQRLNPAFVDRLDAFYYPDLKKKDFISRLKSSTNYKNDKFLEVFYEQFDKLRGIFKTRNLETEVTFRRAESFLKKMLLNPKADLELLFDMSFIYQAGILDLQDLDTDLKELKDIRKEFVSALDNARKDSTEDVKEDFFSCVPALDTDDIDALINSDGSPADPLD